MKLATASAADAPALAALHAAAFPPGAAWSAETIATLLGMQGVVGLTAPGGFILARRVLDEAEILTLAVHPDHRRQGLGEALVETAAVVTAAAGARVMFLEVAEDNAPAMALYAKAGFERAGRRRDYYAPGAHAWLLRRSLEA
ncbi:GNAT family N-acetyltransferase [Roseococcus sp. SDR]|uniref:GNAT family N-acetyltransferase n=1 Tax=Roseococcus sp. SDR TaxID=2835532 RepID=UPI00352FFA7E